MKKMNKLTVAAAALAVLGFASTGAFAQITVGATDLVLGFQVNSSAGAATNLEVDLGDFSQFTTTATLTLSQLSPADLVAAFGSNWASTVSGTGASWSVAGQSDVNSNSFYATSIYTTGGGPKNASASTLGIPYNNIGAFTSDLAADTPTSNSTSSTIITPGANSTPGSYSNTFQNGKSLPSQGSGFGDGAPIAQTTGASSVQLYSFTPGPTTLAEDLGTFSLTSGGVLTFTGAAAAPEPASYALGICAVVLFFVLRRRSTIA